jgi:hypothetical protein
MSASDLRGSLRQALAFEPTFRDHRATRALPVPYLDRISVTDNRGESSPAQKTPQRGVLQTTSYKKLMIQPVSMPDLSHCKLQTNFQKDDVPFMAPDGSLLKGLRTTLQRGFVDAVKTVHEETKQRHQQRQRDSEYYGDDDDRERQFAQHSGQEGEAPLFDRSKFVDTVEELDEMALRGMEDELAEEGGGGRAREKTLRKRKKKKKKVNAKAVEEAGYSVPPKFECMLDFVYGPSNIQGLYKRAHNDQMRAYLPVKR